jgi:hypothetical protein
MNLTLTSIGNRLATFLSKPLPGYECLSDIPCKVLQQHLQPGDLLLVDGKSRISEGIKYLTQSSWSHVALYIGEGHIHQGEAQFPLLEADLVNGVVTVPLEKYRGFNLRICRPVGLSEPDRDAVIQFALQRLGYRYDTKNIFDLMRFLLPNPPVPLRFRRKLIAFGSGDPTKAICSTLIAQAFQSIHYPILPRRCNETGQINLGESDEVLLRKRHFSHFTPRDFDVSPYFEVIKPTLHGDFDFRNMKWSDHCPTPDQEAGN